MPHSRWGARARCDSVLFIVFRGEFVVVPNLERSCSGCVSVVEVHGEVVVQDQVVQLG